MTANPLPPSYAEAFRQGLKPDPLLTVSAWADKHRMLSSVASGEPGQRFSARHRHGGQGSGGVGSWVAPPPAGAWDDYAHVDLPEGMGMWNPPCTTLYLLAKPEHHANLVRLRNDLLAFRMPPMPASIMQ